MEHKLPKSENEHKVPKSIPKLHWFLICKLYLSDRKQQRSLHWKYMYKTNYKEER